MEKSSAPEKLPIRRTFLHCVQLEVWEHQTAGKRHSGSDFHYALLVAEASVLGINQFVLHASCHHHHSSQPSQALSVPSPSRFRRRRRRRIRLLACMWRLPLLLRPVHDNGAVVRNHGDLLSAPRALDVCVLEPVAEEWYADGDDAAAETTQGRGHAVMSGQRTIRTIKQKTEIAGSYQGERGTNHCAEPPSAVTRVLVQRLQ